MSFSDIYDALNSTNFKIGENTKFQAIDTFFQNVQEQIKPLEYKNLREFNHPLLTAADLPSDASVRIQYKDLSTRHTLSLIKRGISFAHGAAIAAASFIESPFSQEQCTQRILERVKQYVNEVERARQAGELGNKKGLKAFQADQFQKLMHDLTRILQLSAKHNAKNIRYKQANKYLIEGERLACWRQRPTIATFTKGKKDQQGKDLHLPLLQIDTPVFEVTPKLQALYEQIPIKYVPKEQIDSAEVEQNKLLSWYDLLSSMEQQWLVGHRDQIINGELGCPPAILRNVPGTANFTKHQTFYELSDKRIASHTEYRHSTSSPIDILAKHSEEKDTVKAIRDDIAAVNAEQILLVTDAKAAFDAFWEGTPAEIKDHLPSPIHLEQSLLSPLGKLDEKVRYAENNLQMARDNYNAFKNADKELSATIEGAAGQESIPAKLVVTNWPINAERGASDPFVNKEIDTKRKTSTDPLTDEELIDDDSEIKDDIVDNQKQAITLLNMVSQYYTVIATKLAPATANPITDKPYGGLLRALNTFFQAEKNGFKIDYDKERKLAEQFLALIKNTDAGVSFAKDLFGEDSQAQMKAVQFVTSLLAAIQYYQLWHLRDKNQTFNGHNRRLFGAGDEAIMVVGTGGTVTSDCKSGKDREATKLMHDSAMVEHALIKDKLPDYYDTGEDRKSFAESFARQFNSGHHQDSANHNSDGVTGCKDGKSKFNIFTTRPMVPVDMQDEVGVASKEFYGTDQYLDCQDALAKLNKPKIADNPYAPQTFAKKIWLGVGAFLLTATLVAALSFLGPLAALSIPFLTHILSIGVGGGLLAQTLGSPDSKKPTALFLVGMAVGLLVGVGLSYMTGGILPLIIVTAVAGVGVGKIVRDFLSPRFRNWWYADKTVEFNSFNTISSLNDLTQGNSNNHVIDILSVNENEEDMETEEMKAYDALVDSVLEDIIAGRPVSQEIQDLINGVTDQQNYSFPSPLKTASVLTQSPSVVIDKEAQDSNSNTPTAAPTATTPTLNN